MAQRGRRHDPPGARSSVHPDNPPFGRPTGTSSPSVGPRATSDQQHGQRCLLAETGVATNAIDPAPSRATPPWLARMGGGERGPALCSHPGAAARHSARKGRVGRVGRSTSSLWPPRGGARPLGGLVHRAGAACRASWPTRSGAQSRRRTPYRCPTSGLAIPSIPPYRRSLVSLRGVERPRRVVRFARLIDRCVRAFWRAFGPRRLRQHQMPTTSSPSVRTAASTASRPRHAAAVCGGRRSRRMPTFRLLGFEAGQEVGMPNWNWSSVEMRASSAAR